MVRDTSISRSGSSSEPLRVVVKAGWALAGAIMMGMAFGGAVRAQGSVSGTVSLQERSSGDHGDLGAAVVYLEARDAGAPMQRDASAPRASSIAMRGREFLP